MEKLDYKENVHGYIGCIILKKECALKLIINVSYLTWFYGYWYYIWLFPKCFEVEKGRFICCLT